MSLLSLYQVMRIRLLMVWAFRDNILEGNKSNKLKKTLGTNSPESIGLSGATSARATEEMQCRWPRQGCDHLFECRNQRDDVPLAQTGLRIISLLSSSGGAE